MRCCYDARRQDCTRIKRRLDRVCAGGKGSGGVCSKNYEDEGYKRY